MNRHRQLPIVLLSAMIALAMMTGCVVIRRRLLGAPPPFSGGGSPQIATGSVATALPSEIVEVPASPASPTPPPSTRGGAIPAEMTLVKLPDATANGTVCNDGSPAGYYIRRGSGAGSRLWIIHLQGGGLCTGSHDCDQRQNELRNFMTSTHLPSAREGEGIMSTSSSESPDFFRANQVYVPYCSSDVWSGDRGASGDTNQRHFRGARIVRGVIEALMDPAITASPNLAEAGQVLFSGSSAGGFGVLVHLDWLAAQLPNASVRGMTDAGWALDIQPFDPGVEPALAQFQSGYGYWRGTVDASCAAANPGAEGRCYLGQYVYPYLQTPLFVQIAQSDGPQLNALGITRPLDDAKKQYIDQFGAAVRASLEPVQAAFSPATPTHGMLLDPDFWRTRIGGLNLTQVLGNWFFSRPGQPVKAIE